MTTKTIAAIVIALIATVGVIGGYKFLFVGNPTVIQQLAGTSPQGSTFNTAKFYGVAGIKLATAGANATSSSILNSTGNDLYPTAVIAGCEGIGTSQTAYIGTGLLSLQLSAGTSSTANPAVAPSTLVTGGVLTIPTSTSIAVVNTVVTSSGLGAAVWPAGTYMTFTTNATNTAVCTFGVTAISS